MSIDLVYIDLVYIDLVYIDHTDHNELANYRPIMNLSYITKIIEKVLSKQLIEYLETNKLYPMYQSAYRKDHSTETVLTRLLNDLLLAVDKGQAAIVVTLDQTAAFDMCDVGILTDRLRCEFGIVGDALKLLHSYLTDRTFRVRTSLSDISVSADTEYGVPQGSIMGPLLYVLYTSPLARLVTNLGLQCHFYADDMQLFYVFKDTNVGCERIELCIKSIQGWMKKNFLKLNPEKTEMLLVGSRHVVKHSPVINININGITLKNVENVKSLGVYLNGDLSMEKFVNEKCKSVSLYLRKLGKVRPLLTFDATQSLLNAFVISRLDYCNSLLAGVSQCLINRLQRLQNWAVRILFKLSKYEHVSYYLSEVHWLPVAQRINFKILLLVFKCINNEAPLYLKDTLLPHKPSRALRSNNKMLLELPCIKTNYGEKAFSFYGAKSWNKLPLSIKESPSVEIFKKRIKTYLFTQTYCSNA